MLQTASKTICSIRPFEEEWCGHLYDRFANTIVYPSECHNLDDYHQQLMENCESWIALREQKIVGFIRLSWEAEFPEFKEENIPQITNLAVFPEVRQQGIATALISRVEPKALRCKRRIGIGIPLSPDRNGIQRLCFKRGFTPRPNGIFYQGKPVTSDQQVIMNDDLLIYMVKSRL